ncbi:MAG: DUF3638 domain-containing protein [Parachlamydiaceae bacterium]|nr:DUF3638 domain-containing protein [Parachlamydiaceae bacterium]
MDIKKATALLLSLEARIKNVDCLGKQMHRHFVPSLWGNNATLSTSLHGRLSIIYNSNKSNATQRRRINSTFFEASKAISRDAKTSAKFSLRFRNALARYLEQEGCTHTDGPIKVENPTPAEFRKLELVVDDVVKDRARESERKEKEHRENSLIHQDSYVVTHRVPDLTAFNTLFQAERGTPEFSAQFDAYLKKHPEAMHKYAQDRLESAVEGQKAVLDIEKQLKTSTPLTAKERNNVLREFAGSMQTKLAGLKPGERWMLCGGYGRAVSSKELLTLLMTKLPDDVLSQLPTPIADAFKKGEMPDIAEVVSSALMTQMKGISVTEALNTPILKAFLPDASRQVPSLDKFPAFLKKGIEDWFQQGLAGNLMEITPDGSFREFILAIVTKSSELSTQTNAHDAMMKEMAQFLTGKMSIPTLQQGPEVLNYLYSDFLKHCPTFGLQLLGADHLTDNGCYWIEFERQGDDNYTLHIYSTGKALNHYPKNQQGEIQWPLRFVDIPASRFEGTEENDKTTTDERPVDFLHRLLTHRFEPQFNQEFTSRSDDLQSLIQTLSGDRSSVPGNWRHIDPVKTSESYVLQLMKTNKSPNLIAFEMQVDSTVALCREELRGRNLSLRIEDSQLCSALETAVSHLEQGVNDFSKSIDPTRLAHIKTMNEEIRLAIKAFYDSKQSVRVKLPSQASQFPPIIQKMLQNQEALSCVLQYKTTIRWALGDEMGDFIDSLADMMSTQLEDRPAVQASVATPVKTPPAKNSPRGYLGTILLHTYLQLAIKGLQIALLLSELYSAGYGIVFTEPFKWVLGKVLPTVIQEWYALFMGEVRRRLTELMFSFVMRLFYSKEGVLALQTSWRSLQAQIISHAATLNGSTPLNFTITPVQPTPQFEMLTIEPPKLDQVQEVVPEKASDRTLHGASQFIEESFSGFDEEISGKNITETLEHWLITSQKYSTTKLCTYNEPIKQPSISIRYLLARIEKLTIPEVGKRDYWDTVENPNECMDLLNTLTQQLGSLNCSLQDSPRCVVSSFAILCIIDKLARRDPELGLNNERVDAYNFIDWLNDNSHHIDDPVVYEQCKKIAAYLAPEIDLSNIEHQGDLGKRSQKALFNYSFLGDAQLQNFKDKDGNTRQSKSTTLITAKTQPEFKYLTKLLKRPEVQKKLLKLGIDPKKAPEAILLQVLFDESFVFTRGEDALIPASYRLLRLQTFACKSILKEMCRFKWWNNNYLSHGSSEGSRPLLDNYLKSVKHIEPRNHNLNHHGLKNSSWQQTMNILYLDVDDISILSEHRVVHHHVDTQSQTISLFNKSQRFFDTVSSSIPTEPSDQIARFLSHYQSTNNNFPRHLGNFNLKQAFLRFGVLPSQLKSSPAFAESIGESLTKWLQRYSEDSPRHDFADFAEMISLGLVIKRYCAHYAPNHIHTFPDFRTAILQERERAQKSGYADYDALNALTYDLEVSQKEEDLEDAVASISLAFFAFNYMGLSFDKTYLPLNLHHKYLDCLPYLNILMKQESFRNRLLNSIANHINLNIPKDATWQETDSPMRYFSGNLSVDFLSGTFFRREGSDSVLIQGMRKKDDFLSNQLCIAKSCVPTTMVLNRVSEDLYRSEDGTVYVQFNKGDNTPHGIRFFDSKVYEHLPLSRIDHSWAFGHLFKGNIKGLTFWLESSSEAEKELLCYDNDQLVQRLPVKAKEAAVDAEGRISAATVLEYELKKPTQMLLTPDRYKAQLAPLTRFCTISQMICSAKPGETQISEINLISFGLEFDVTTVEGEIRAYSRQHNGYYIRPVQQQQELSNFANTLVLTNQNGDLKVVLPSQNWSSDYAWKALSQLGPYVGSLIRNQLSGVLSGSNATKTQQCYIYDLDQSTGRLTSENPEALAHLLSTYVIQNNMELSLQTCTKLEHLCKRTTVSVNIISLLYPLFNPVGNVEISWMRQRLFAALEENRLIRSVTNKAQSNTNLPKPENPNAKIHLLTIPLLLLDLAKFNQTSNPRYHLSEYQEWFLYKRLLFCLQHNLSQDLWHYIQKFGVEHLLANALLPPKIRLRFERLKEKFDQKPSVKLRIAGFASRVWATSGVDTTLHVPKSNSDTGFFQECADVASKTKLYKTELLTSELVQEMSNTPPTDHPPLSMNKVNAREIRRHFLSYYIIARGQGLPDKQQKLARLLPFIQGGWDPQSALLIRYLQNVISFPQLFPKKKELLEICKMQKNNILLNPDAQLHDFLKALNSKCRAYDISTAGAGVLIENVASTVLSTQLTSVLSLKTLSNELASAVKWGTKVATTVATDRRTQQFESKETASRTVSTSFADLSHEDKLVDDALNTLFYQTFEMLSFENQQRQMTSRFSLASSDHVEQASLERLDTSVKDYYKRSDRTPAFLRLRSPEALWSLSTNLRTCRDILKKSQAEDLDKLLNMVNTACPGRNVTIQDLYRFFLKGNVEEFSALSQLPTYALKEVDRLIALYIARQTRLQQIQRAIGLLDTLININPQDKDKYEQVAEQLADELRARRSYDFTTTAPRILRRFMLFELITDKMLWLKQSSSLIQALRSENEHVVIELLMSLGKTFFFAPTSASYFADGKTVVFNIWTTNLFGTCVRQLSEQSTNIFDQVVNTLQIDRSTPLMPENFSAMLTMVNRAREQGESISMTKESSMALRLLFLDNLYTLTNAPKKRKGHEGELLLQLASFLSVMRFGGGLAIGDEAHELFFNKRKLEYPLGAASTVPLKHYQVIEICMRALMEFPNVLELFRSNKPAAIEKMYDAEILPYLAKKASQYWKFEIKDERQREDFITFVSGKATAIPKWIQEHKRYGEISIVKGMLANMLKTFIQRKMHVEFGPSKNGKDDVVRPYDGHQGAQENSTISNYIEATIKTMLTFLHQPLKAGQINFIIKELKEKMPKEMNAHSRTALETNVQKRFDKMTGAKKFDLSKLSECQEGDELHTAMCHNPEAAFFYLRNKVRSQIRYWKRSISCNAHNFGSLWGRQQHYTGTPYNDGSYPGHVKLLLDPGTSGEAMHIISQKCPKNGIHIYTKSEPREILREQLHKFFQPGSNFTALIDGGAKLQGMTNEQVAHYMVAFCREYRPDIKAIDVFLPDPKEGGRETLMTLRYDNNSYEIISYDSKLSLDNRLAYFDQRRGFGANIPQKANGKALLLFGDDQFLYRLLQELFRMRGIKIFKRMVEKALSQEELEFLNLTQRQTIEIAMSPEVAAKVAPEGGKPTLEQIFIHAARNEARLVSNDNYNSYREMVYDVIQQAILDKILKTGSVKKMMSLFVKGQSLLITEQEEDPSKVHGLIDIDIPVENARKNMRETAMKKALQTTIFSSKELADLKTKMDALNVPVMPEKVQVSTDGKSIKTDNFADLGRELNHEMETEAENEKEQEQEKEKEKEKQQTVSGTHSISELTEWGWENPIDVRSRHWLRFEKPNAVSSSLLKTCIDKAKRLAAKFTFSKFTGEAPPLFRVTDLLAVSSVDLLQKVTNAFDSRIWVTNNVVPTVIRNVLENSTEIGREDQRELYEVLVHLEDNGQDLNIQSVGWLSQRDAGQIRRQLSRTEGETKSKEADSKSFRQKVILYDPVLENVVAGDAVDRKRLRSNSDLARLIASMKFLNADLKYNRYEKGLEEWLQKAGAERMQEAFHHIHALRGSGTLSGSEIDVLFDKINNVPDNERAY